MKKTDITFELNEYELGIIFKALKLSLVDYIQKQLRWECSPTNVKKEFINEPEWKLILKIGDRCIKDFNHKSLIKAYHKFYIN